MATDPEVRVRFPALADFLRSSRSGTGSTQPSTIEEVLERKNSGSGLEIRYYGRRGSAVLATRNTSIHKRSALTSQKSAV
jgi:hypothetical protein